MRRLNSVVEFKEEAANALFTKQQAVAVTLGLLERERLAAENTTGEADLFADAIAHAEFRYLDTTQTEVDRMLDSMSVARFTATDIADAIDAIIFDVQK